MAAMRHAVVIAMLFVCCAAGAAPAQAATAPDIVVWVGPTVPGTALRGVHLKSSGQGELLVVSASGRKTGLPLSAGAVSATGAQLEAIRNAAQALDSQPGVRVVAPHGEMYASAVITIGAKQRTTLELGAASPAMGTLLNAINAVLKPDDVLPVPLDAAPVPALPAASSAHARAASADAAAKCPPGQTATSAAREIPLKNAAAAGMVKLTSKGAIGGDSVAVDAIWKPVNGPVKVTVNIELVDSGSGPAEPTPAQVEQAIESTLAGKLNYKGRPIKMDAVVTRRSSTDAPTPCFHQIYFYPDAGVRDHVDGLDGLTNPLPQSGQWNYGTASDARTWSHETMHLLGLDDQYRDYLKLKNGTEVQVPKTVNSEDTDALKQWAAQKGLKIKDAILHSVPNKGHEKDLMADDSAKDFTIPSASLAGIYAASAKHVVIHADPGELLLNKNSANQNLGVGAPFDLTVAKGTPAHVDGLVAYCIDLSRHVPNAGGGLDGFDVLGNAADRPEPAMQALGAVLREVAARQPRPLAATPGASSAIWRITDDASLSGSAAEILAGAGLSADEPGSYGAPHFNNPNAAGPDTASVSESTVDATVEHDPGLEAVLDQEAELPAAGLTAIRVVQRTIRRQRSGRALLGIEIEVTGQPANLRVGVRRRGRSSAVRTITRRLAVGATSFNLTLPRLRAGSYEVRASGAGTRTAAFRLR